MTSIKTKFGKAYIGTDGYYRIFSIKEGNRGKLLHRLIFEEFYNISLPKNVIIHHDDGNKTNNNIWNLLPLTNEEHTSLHHKGNQHRKGQVVSVETRKKMSGSHKGKTQSESHNLNISKSQNTSGYYRVSIKKDKRYSQGFSYRYQYYDTSNKAKELWSVSLDKLKKKVISKGLKWQKLDDLEVIE